MSALGPEELYAEYAVPESIPEEHKSNVSVIITNLRSFLFQHRVHIKWHLRDFEIGCPLGIGQSGRVYLVREMTSQFMVAIKVLYKSELKGIELQMLRQIEAETRLRHPNVLKLLTCFFDETRYFVVLEYAAKGDLFEYLRKAPNRRFTEDLAARFIYQVTCALHYYQSNNVMHRDIKPENLFLTSLGDIKLADFGWCAHAPSSRRKTMCGTLDYMPPEVVERKTYDECSDRWCLGVLCYELLVGQLPFPTVNPNPTNFHIEGKDLHFPSHVSTDAQDLIKRLLRKNPIERLPLRGVLRHHWIERNVN